MIINLQFCMYLVWIGLINFIFKQMREVFQSKLQKMILVICLSKFVLTDWLSLQNDTVNVPAHVFSIFLGSNEILTGLLTWNNSADLDIYIFQSGKDIMNHYNATSYSSSLQPYKQNFTFTSRSSKTYYIRVSPFTLSSNNFLTYNLALTTNSTSVTYTEIFVQNYLNYRAVVIPNTFSFTNIAFKYQTNSNLAQYATLIYSSSVINLSSNLVLSLCNSSISSPDNWTLIIKDTINSTQILTPVAYNISYYQDYSGCPCFNNQTWDNVTQRCQNIGENTTHNDNTQANPQTNLQTNSSKSQVTIVIAVLVPVILVAIIVAGVFLWRRYKNLQADQKIGENKRQVNDSHHQIKGEQCCSICLEYNCNYTIKCKHMFHRSCIEAWLKKNNICPLCRTGISVLR